MRHLAWPLSLRGQMIALVLIGLSITQILTFVFSRLQHQHRMIATRDENTLLRIASVAHLLAETPAEVHERICRAISSRVLQLSIAPAPVLHTSTATRHSMRLRQRLAALLGTESADIRIGFGSVPRPDAPGHTGWHGPRDAHAQGRRGPTPRPATDLVGFLPHSVRLFIRANLLPSDGFRTGKLRILRRVQLKARASSSLVRRNAAGAAGHREAARPHS